MIDKMLNKLQTPDNKYRAIPFWSWNDALDNDTLRHQVNDMAQAGFGGYFIHARAGLKTPYFSEQWMQGIEACVDQGRKEGVHSWLYDENGYPSGFAGGKVPAKGLAYQQKFLQFERVFADALRYTEHSLAVYDVDAGYHRISPDTVQGEEQLLHVCYSVNPYYADLLDRHVVQDFIEETYEPYYQRFQQYFGKEIPGIFTDEPQYGRAAMPWSFVLPEEFLQRCGYDILDCLPALFAEVSGYQKARYDFWNTVTALFVSSCAEQLGQWCKAHGCKLTGHVLLEDDIRFQTMCNGSAMAFYRHMDIPGIDWLGKATGNPVIVKQVVSVAAQMGKDLVLSEMFAAAGWNTTLSELKHIAQWQYALGINLTCDHLYPYSLAGMRKKDHPPGISYQSNWWTQCRTFNDYFARLGMLLSEGRQGEQLLVIHPLRSGWIALDAGCYPTGTNAELHRIDSGFEQLSEMLSGLHMDYHFGDEGMMAEIGVVEADALVIGQCRYHSVLIPRATTLEETTIDLLLKFAKNGGKLYALENNFPTIINGVPSERLSQLQAACQLLGLDRSGLQPLLTQTGCKPVQVQDKQGEEIANILHRVSRYDEGTALYLVNMDLDSKHDCVVRLDGYQTVQLLQLEDCTAQPLTIRADGTVLLSLAPSQSAVLYFTNEVQDTELLTVQAPQVVPWQDGWTAQALSHNVLVLDSCTLSIEGGEPSQQQSIVHIQKQLLEIGHSVDVCLDFTVDVRYDIAPDAPLYLVIEHGQDYTLCINGTAVSTQTDDWWKDHLFSKIDVSGKFHKGHNTIVLRTRFVNSPALMAKLERAKVFEAEMNMLTFDTELENIYLLGDFLVKCEHPTQEAPRDALLQKGPFYLDAQLVQVCEEWTSNGYPFFTGAILLTQTVDLLPGGRVVFRMGKPHCAYCKLSVNDKEVKTFLWTPYEVDITDHLIPGQNTLTVEIISTDRNLFGPHHHPRGELHALGPVQFTEAEGWEPGYSLVKFGLRNGLQKV